MEWVYKGKIVTDLSDEVFGFVYCITYTDGTKYIGKKQVISEVTLPALKSGVQRPNSRRIGKNKNGKRVYYDVVTKPKKWRDYEGSTEFSEGKTIADKEMLEVAHSRRFLTYLEAKYQFSLGVLEDDSYLNRNILNKFHPNIKD